MDGVRFRKPLRTTDWQQARSREREECDTARKGAQTSKEAPKLLGAAIESYLREKAVAHSRRTVEIEEERLRVVTKHFGDCKLRAITPEAVAQYQRVRKAAGIAGRTINMDVGALRRVLKFCGRWRLFAERVRNFPENYDEPRGRVLTVKEQARLFEVARSNPDWEHVWCAATVAANTSLRPVEVKHLRWKDVDLVEGVVTVRRSKLATSHRAIPLAPSARKAFGRMWERASTLGFTQPGHYVWPACQWGRIDPTRPIKKWDSAWHSLTRSAGLKGLRFHDLRHTIITELGERGEGDQV